MEFIKKLFFAATHCGDIRGRESKSTQLNFVVKILISFFIFISFFFLAHSSVHAATYYVANTGNDSCDGTSQTIGSSGVCAWRTISKVNETSFVAGDSILFNRGDVWRETLTVPASNLTFDAYGSGNAPLIKGSDVFSTWTAVPTPTFSDNFETGDLSKWDTPETSNGIIATSTTQAFEGTYSVKASITSAGGFARAVKNSAISAGNGGDAWVTVRMYVASNFSVSDNTLLLKLTENGGDFNSIRLGINSSNQVYVLNPADGFATYASSTPIPLGQWFSLRWHIHVANPGKVRVWVDDNEVINEDVNTFITNPWSHLRVGVDAAVGDTPTVYYDYVRVGNVAEDPSVATGYYKSGFTTQPNDAFANSQRLLVSPIDASYYPMAYHLYEGSSRMGYDPYTGIVYIRAPSDADPATLTIEIPQRDNGIFINNKDSVTLKNTSVQQTNDKTYGGVRITGPGGGHTISSIDASYNADAGLEIDGGSTNSSITGGTFNNNMRYGIKLYQSNNNTVTGTTSGGTLEDINGALIAQQSDGSLFDGNTINDTVGYAIDCYTSKNIIMRNNTATNPQNGGYTVEGSCTNFLIEKNTVTNTILAGGIMVLPTVAGSSSGTIQYNTVINSLDGIWLNDHIADNTIVQYNIVRNTKSTTTHGDIAVRIADGVKIYNNTLVNGGGDGIAFFSNGLDAPDNSLVKNNIVYGNTGYSLNVSSGTVFNGTGNVWDYNDYYKSSGSIFSWAGTNYTLAQFLNYKNASSQDSHSIVSDPLLLNIAGNDFRLSGTSPAINIGIDVGLTRDFTGTTVPQGSAPDIGAYEYVVPVPDNSSSSNSNSSGSGSSCGDSGSTGAPNLFEIRTTKNSAILFFAPPVMPYSNFYIAYSRRPDIWEYGTQYNQGYSSGVLQYTVNSLQPNTKYYFKVRSGNGCAVGAWGNTMTAATTNSNQTKSYFKLLGVGIVQQEKAVPKKPLSVKKVSNSPANTPAPESGLSPKIYTQSPTYIPVQTTPQPTPKPKFCILWWCF